MAQRGCIGRRTALTALLAAALSSPLAARAGDPVDCKLLKKGKVVIETIDSRQECKRLGGLALRQYYCEFRKAGKTEIKPTPSPQDCSRVGGKVVRKPKVPRGTRSQRPLN